MKLQFQFQIKMTIFTKPFADKGKLQPTELNEAENGFTAPVSMVNIYICCTFVYMLRTNTTQIIFILSKYLYIEWIALSYPLQHLVFFTGSCLEKRRRQQERGEEEEKEKNIYDDDNNHNVNVHILLLLNVTYIIRIA